MVTKGYQKGVYERVTKGIRAEPEGKDLVQTRYVASMENCIVFRLRFEWARLRPPCQGLFFPGVSRRGLKPHPFKTWFHARRRKPKEHDMD